METDSVTLGVCQAPLSGELHVGRGRQFASQDPPYPPIQASKNPFILPFAVEPGCRQSSQVEATKKDFYCRPLRKLDCCPPAFTLRPSVVVGIDLSLEILQNYGARPQSVGEQNQMGNL